MRVGIVGGGIVGLAAATYLARRGADVTVCERGSIGAGSTERSAGGIRAQFSTRVNVDLSLASMDVWESFEDEFGVDIAYRRAGYLFCAREEATADAFRETVEMQREAGVPAELLSPEEARDHCPELHADQFVAATYSPTDGFADPHLALQGYAEAAREAGVEIRTKTAVTDIVRESPGATAESDGDGGEGCVVGVETVSAGGEQERLDCEFVVNAAGPWAGQIAEMAGVDLPVTAQRRQIAVVDPETPIPDSVPLTIDLDTGSYFRPEREGRALVGGFFGDEADSVVDPDDYTKDIDLDWTAEAMERAADTAGYFGPDSRVARGWAGLYAVTPDHHPIVEERAGFVNAVGFSGHGFQHAPAVGQIVAELVHDGEASLVDIEPLRSDRFEDGDGLVERNVA
ncbi:NAD(P)/FAD-dependent oxidoreductase [Salinirubrum litoreum]|uniref:NAD(P)/FAD-dependent oxidoreductase n=1 Tax=Salinirubrum litoreum TaxID=1126234 RepID=A0ABD5RE34_9EURY|nr:FAD-dependent oxidoreductase [Salinirubrum litoreum]